MVNYRRDEIMKIDDMLTKCELITVNRPDTAPEGGMRTKKCIGYAGYMPIVGRPFNMFSERPIDPTKDIRYIETTKVKTVNKAKNTYTFTTESGTTYKLKIEKKKK